jgi:rhodanese-related sulfurtransferase
MVTLLVFSGCSTVIGKVEEISSSETMEKAEKIEGTEEPEETASKEETGQVEEAEEAVVQIISITPKEVFEIIENKEEYIIVDVRTKEEFVGGHLEEALLLPVQELEGRLDELPKDKPIIVYCRSGSRSRTAAEILVANGFTMVYDMGGISSWIEEGYPVIVEE